MNIAMSGATGFIGGSLIKKFAGEDWSVIPLLVEDFKSDAILSEKLKSSDIVINLAGAPVIGKWTEEYKKILYSSRIETTSKIVSIINNQNPKPRLFISTSAVGIYDGSEVYSEDNAVYANDFLGRLAIDWEKAANKAKDGGIRTVIFRFGIVLGNNGGILSNMLPFFRTGLGGTIGDGSQGFSWVHISDLQKAFIEAIVNEKLSGVYNLTAPNPTTNKGLTKALGKVLHKPTIFRIPYFALKLRYGEGAIAVAGGQKVLPKRLLETGFQFEFKTIEEALESLLINPKKGE